MLRADDVLNAKFQATKFREGYDQDQVDDFLDRVVSTLRAREGGPSATRPVTVEEVARVTFQATKFREGYDQDDVDDFLERVRESLGGAPSALTAGGAPAAVRDTPTPGAITTGRRGLFGRRRDR